MKAGQAVVFTDGAAKGNPGPGGWGSVVLMPERVVELGDGEEHTTNNRMEMTAVIKALEFLDQEDPELHALIFTDSSYVIDGATKWVAGWKRRGWKKADGNEVLNRDLWETLSDLCAARLRGGGMTWRRVRGHAGILGNERADEIASESALGNDPALYEGPIGGYEHDPDEFVRDAEASYVGAGGGAGKKKRTKASTVSKSVSARKSSGAKAKAHSYLSVVGGVVQRHATWPECERAVKGKSGARFKKAMTAEDEAQIVSGWGVRLPEG